MLTSVQPTHLLHSPPLRLMNLGHICSVRAQPDSQLEQAPTASTSANAEPKRKRGALSECCSWGLCCHNLLSSRRSTVAGGASQPMLQGSLVGAVEGCRQQPMPWCFHRTE